MRRVKVGHVVEALTAGHQALFHCITALSCTKVGARRGGSVPQAHVRGWIRVGHLFMDTITLGGKYLEDILRINIQHGFLSDICANQIVVHD
jgi:hypothetical protein